MAECARCQFDLSKVLFITSARPPHRNRDLLGGEERHAMVEAAVADNPFFQASRMELDRKLVSYTVDTLLELQEQTGAGTRLNLIVGGDNIDSIGSWHRADELFTICRLLAAPRLMPDEKASGQLYEKMPQAPAGANLEVIDFPPVSVSSSEVRQRLRQGKSVLYMVPPAVNNLLITRAHYRSEYEPNAH